MFGLLVGRFPAVALPPPCDLEHTLVRQLHSMPSGSGGASGLVASSRYPGWGWTIRDSGHPSLYAVRFRGKAPLVREVPVVGATNVDWEEIVYATNRDGTGRLYVVESDQSRLDRSIYKMGEPDPETALAVTRWTRFRYAYPGGRRDNTEAAFFHNSRLVLVTKTNPARVYRFEERLSPHRVNIPRFLGELTGSPRIAVARVSPDGRTLITANRNYLWVYRAGRRDASLRAFLDRPPDHTHRITPAGGDNIKAGDFFPAGGCELVFVAKSTSVYRVLPGAAPLPVPVPVWPHRVYQQRAVPSPHGEVSGLAASRRWPDVMWAVRDSGNPASLFRLVPSPVTGAYDVREIPVRGASNSDWESLSYADEGAAGTYLYIHDNRGNRSVNPKRLYKVREPHPRAATSAAVTATYYWQFPRHAGTNTCGGQFNSEAITLFPLQQGQVTDRTRFYAVQKHRGNGRIYDFGPLHRLSRSPRNPTRGTLVGNLDIACPSEFHVHPDNRSAIAVQSGGGTGPGKVKIIEGHGATIESFTRRRGTILLDHRDLIGEKGNTEAATWWPWDGRNFQVIAESKEGWLYQAAPGR